MSTGRYTRIHTRWPSDPLIPAHQRCYAFAIALPHSIFHTQQYSIHRFAESCHGSNLHSTLLYPTFNYIDGYYNLQAHQYHSHSHFHSESPTWRFTTTSFHPTRHLLFILPLSQPHLLSFHLFYFSGLAERDLGSIYAADTIPTHFYSPLFVPFIITHSTHSSQNKHSIHISNQSLPNTFLHNSQGNSLRSLNIYSLCMRIHSNHDERRVTQQSPPYEPLRRSKDSRRTRLRHRNHLLNARVCCCAMLCNAVQCCALLCTAVHCTALRR